MGTYQATILYATGQGTVGYSHLSALSHCELILACGEELVYVTECPLISFYLFIFYVQAGNEFSNILPKSPHERKKPPPIIVRYRLTTASFRLSTVARRGFLGPHEVNLTPHPVIDHVLREGVKQCTNGKGHFLSKSSSNSMRPEANLHFQYIFSLFFRLNKDFLGAQKVL